MNLKLLNTALDLPKEVAMNFASELFDGGSGCEKDEETASTIIYELAARGYSEAQYFLYCDFDDNGDIENAIHWLAKAVQQDNPKAQAMLFVEYYAGNIDWLNDETALECLMKAVDNEMPSAMVMLGDQYFHGSSVIEVDQDQAIVYYRKAANLNEPIGQLYMYFRYMEEDEELALSWLRKSADNGCSEAKYELWKELSKEAFKWLQAAKEDDYQEAVFDYARLEETDVFMERDTEDSFRLYKNLIRQNHTRSADRVVFEAFDKEYEELIKELLENGHYEALTILLRNQLYKGIEIGKNMKYLNKAANLGSNEAMYELGMISLNEFGIEGFVKNQNVIKAYDYIFRAARQNYSPAMEFIASEYIKGNNIGSLDDKDVIDFLLKAIEQDNGMALNLMGVLCFEGKYMEKDLEKAEYYFDEAIDQDNSTAYYNRGKLYEQEGDRESALDCYTLGADMDEYYCLVELLKDIEYLTSMYSLNTIDWLKQSVKEIEALPEKTFAVKCDASRIIK